MSTMDERGDVAWWTRPSFVVSAVLVGLLVLGAVVIATTGPSESPADTPAATTKVPAAAAPARRAASTGCNQPAGSQTVPTVAPADTKWELVGSMAAPTAPDTYGPGKTKDGLRTCFAHSPTGALYAAISFWATGTMKRSAELYAHLAADTTARAKAVKETAGDTEPQLAGPTKLQVTGFSVLSYSDTQATIDIAFRVRNGGLLHVPTAVRFEQGDWRYLIPETGSTGVTPLTDLSGYIPWEGA